MAVTFSTKLISFFLSISNASFEPSLTYPPTITWKMSLYKLSMYARSMFIEEQRQNRRAQLSTHS